MNRDMLFRELESYNSMNTARKYAWEFENFAPEADPILFYEDVKIKTGETLIGLAAEYGFDPNDWREIWNDAKNAALRGKRGLSTDLQSGDVVYMPIKWRILRKTLVPSGTTFFMSAKRNGKEGGRLDWVQTVYGHNQPKYGKEKKFPQFSVDEPTWDNTPFYATQKMFDTDTIRRNVIRDTPNRHTPTPEMGTTTWRAVTSLCVVTNKRVSIWDTYVWGINFQPNGVNVPYPIRPATQDEINGHLNLLRKKIGSAKKPFSELGWTFVNRNPAFV
jgi:hypothetical protein